MNDIYAQKAKKYKYKYLKLKKELEGGDDFKFIGYGGFGCIISPPIKFNITTIDEKIFTSKDYVAKLLSYEAFLDEKKEFEEIESIDKEGNHRSKLIYAEKMKKKDLTDKINIIINEDRNKEDRNKLVTCLQQKKLLKQIRESDEAEYGYIISTKVGTSFDKLNNFRFENENKQIIDNSKIDSIKLESCNEKDITTILNNLKTSIEDLITKLYTNNFIHGDLKSPNITLDKNYNVYFIDFGFMKEYDNLYYINGYSQNENYPNILKTFFSIFPTTTIPNDPTKKAFFINSRPITKLNLIYLLNKSKNNFQNIIEPRLLQYTKLFNIDYSFFFNSLEDNSPYSPQVIYDNCIKPIAKNIDIYALSLFIYQLFNKIFSGQSSFDSKYINDRKMNAINAIIKMLLINVLYNNIDGPEELIFYLEAIIDTLNGTYIKGDVKKKIYERRITPKVNIPYKNCFFNGYSIKYNANDFEDIIPYGEPRQQYGPYLDMRYNQPRPYTR